MSKILQEDIERIQVSSVMKNDKNFGKQNIFDGNDDTCWSSDEGKPQWVRVDFKKPHSVSSFSIQFQGGFVGEDILIEFFNDESVQSEKFYAEDVNSVQNFKLTKSLSCKKIKFIFEKSSDFFGRVVVYSINIFID